MATKKRTTKKTKAKSGVKSLAAAKKRIVKVIDITFNEAKKKLKAEVCKCKVVTTKKKRAAKKTRKSK